MKRSYIVLLFAIVISGCTYPRPNYIMTASPEIREILREYSVRKDGVTHINLSRFERANIKYRKLEKRMPDECYCFDLPDNPNIEDEFRYRIIKERDSDAFWVLRYGGVASVSELYQLKTETVGIEEQPIQPPRD